MKPTATEAMSKTKSLKFLMWDEKSIRQNKKRNKGSNVQQLERLYLVQSEDNGLVFKKRKFFSGTSHGDCIGPILAPDWNETLMHVYKSRQCCISVPQFVPLKKSRSGSLA